MKYCHKCGAKLLEDAKFCANCGAEVPAKATAEPIETTTEADVKTAESAIAETDNATKSPVTQAFNAPKQQDSEEKTSILKKIGIAFSILISLALILIIIVAAATSTSKNFEKGAKRMTKLEIADAWKEFDDKLELKKITYDSISVDEMDEDEIAAYITETGNRGYVDSDGTRYDTAFEYWESQNYDPYNDVYRLYTVKGDYHVTDNRKQDYEGWYCVVLLHIEGRNVWKTMDTEMELPDELRQYLPD